jgi:hypothetical protein
VASKLISFFFFILKWFGLTRGADWLVVVVMLSLFTFLTKINKMIPTERKRSEAEDRTGKGEGRKGGGRGLHAKHSRIIRCDNISIGVTIHRRPIKNIAIVWFILSCLSSGGL